VSADRKFVHDMKNMLGVVIGYSTLLLDEIPPDDPRRPDIEEIRRAGDGALSVLEGWRAAKLPED
jgi:hypothetical protein